MLKNVTLISGSNKARFVDLLSRLEKKRKKKNIYIYKLLLSFWHWSIINILCFELFIPMVKLNELCMREGSVANCILSNYGMD